ncbi:MAG: recombination regulator RecX [Lachnospiraceae bacterium]|nr:recombination regulator RecX [Lachnospiraceae bacterium]
MQVLKISRVFGSRKEKYFALIYLDKSAEETQFPLYPSELKKYGITEGLECDDSLYYKIEKEVLKKRILARCGYLLAKCPYTEKELKEKLTKDHYPQKLVDMAVSKMKDFSYINDEDLALRYMELNRTKKSTRLIMKELEQKGVDKGILDEMPVDESNEDVLEALAEKKCKGADLSDIKQKNRVYRFLLSRGFSFEEVSAILEKIINRSEREA